MVQNDGKIHKALEKIEDLEVETNKRVKNIEKEVISNVGNATKAAKGQLSGFMSFIREKGVIGLAIGIIIGTAVTKTVTALVNDIVNPLVGLILPKAETLKSSFFQIGDAKILWGDFTAAIIDLIVVSAVVYFGIKGLGLDKFDKKNE